MSEELTRKGLREAAAKKYGQRVLNEVHLPEIAAGIERDLAHTANGARAMPLGLGKYAPDWMNRGLGFGKHHTVDRITSAAATGGKIALVGTLVAGGALLLSNMGLFGKSKTGKDSAQADGELEAMQAAQGPQSMVMRAEEALPPPTLMGEMPKAGDMASKVRPHGPIQLGVDKPSDGGHSLAI